ncbi:MAG: hypothetical protein ACRD51_07795 [Candidatus Acidiferrum sp.]
MADSPDSAKAFLRHAVATVAYRGGKAIRGAPESFPSFEAGENARTPAKLLSHIGDLFDWALSIASGKQSWHDSKPLSWDAETARFFASLQKFDDYLASPEPLRCPAEALLQGPIADALTHVGQIALLRRLAACPIKGENYFKAEIAVGRVGSDQPAPRNEFS